MSAPPLPMGFLPLRCEQFVGATEAMPLRDPDGSLVAPTWKPRMEDPPASGRAEVSVTLT